MADDGDDAELRRFLNEFLPCGLPADMRPGLRFRRVWTSAEASKLGSAVAEKIRSEFNAVFVSAHEPALGSLNREASDVSGKEAAGHVFISYVREDSDRVDQLQRVLQEAGIPVWRDTADLWPGEDWRSRIRDAITSNALVFLACFSRASLARSMSYQNEEFVLAIEQLRQRAPERPWLIPVRFDDCEIPDRDIGGGRSLTSIQRADLFGGRVDEGMERLVVAVLRILGRHANVTPTGGPVRDAEAAPQ